jgi:ribosomal protein S19E (S16A)
MNLCFAGPKVHRGLLRFLEAPGKAFNSRYVEFRRYKDYVILIKTTGWVDTVKTSPSNELPPQDADWYADSLCG